MLLLSVGMVVVSVRHELLQRCIIIDMQHLLQVSQSCCMAFGLLSCSTSMTSMKATHDSSLSLISKHPPALTLQGVREWLRYALLELTVEW